MITKLYELRLMYSRIEANFPELHNRFPSNDVLQALLIFIINHGVVSLIIQGLQLDAFQGHVCEIKSGKFHF